MAREYALHLLEIRSYPRKSGNGDKQKQIKLEKGTECQKLSQECSQKRISEQFGKHSKQEKIFSMFEWSIHLYNPNMGVGKETQ